MFRTIFNQVKRPFDLSALTAGYCTKAPVQQRRIREINEVRLVGTLINDSFVLQSGTRALTVKTRDSPLKYSIHNVHIRTEGDFAAGKRVYLQGKLRSTFQTLPDTGRNVTCSIVKAHQLYVLENESASLDPTEGDQNQVELLAHISSEVLHKDNHSTFAVATHFKRTDPDKSGEGGEGEEGDAVNFHRVFVHDEGLRQYIQNHVKRSDRVLLTGRIDHMTHTGTDGKRVYSGFIVADNIYRVARRPKTTDAVESNSEAKAEN